MRQQDAVLRQYPVLWGVLFLLMIVAGPVMTFVAFVTPLTESMSARNWVKQNCRILESRVVTTETVSTDHNSRSFKFEVLYEYTYGGIRYQSTRYSFFGILSVQIGAQKMVEKFPARGIRQCYVNPGNPSEAVLQRDFEAVDLLGLVPLIFTVGGVAGLRQQLKLRQTGKPSVVFKEVTLKRNSRLKKAVIVFCVAMFFCGADIVIWKSAALAVSFRTPEQIFTTIQTILPVFFGVVVGFFGFVLFLVSIYLFMEVFNPAVRVTLTPLPVEIGKAAAIAWDVQGKVERVKHLNILLECRRITTKVRKGTTRRNSKTVWSEELTATADLKEIAKGEFGFVIGPNQSHTFKNEQDSIVWYVVVKGKIRHWPDIEDEFEFDVIKNGVSQKV